MLGFLKYSPTVYCVRNKYQIVFVTKETGAGAVIINGKRYTDNVCGVVRSASCVHRIEINAEILDQAGGYTVEWKCIPERTPYNPKTISTETAEFSFRSIPKDGDINCYILSDTHGNVVEPIEAATYFGEKLDLLILGGDMGRNVADENGILVIARLASEIAKGEIPVIFMRGNHDTRGAFAEFLPDYVGTDHGRTFYPIRIGRLWFVVLDAGEDKLDHHEEYGDIADYAAMRQEQIDMLEELIEHAHDEYDANGVAVRIALSHAPLRCITAFPELLSKWTELLNKMGIQIMLTGHTHRALFVSSDQTTFPIPKHCFPWVECAAINKQNLSTYKGTALTIGKDQMTIRFTDVQHHITEEHVVFLNRI